MTVVIAPVDEAQTCPLDEANLDDVVYSAAVTGGSGTYDYSWTVMGNNIASPCGNEPTCRVDFADSEFCGEISVQVEVADAAGSCPPVQTDPEVVSKSTTVIATSGD